MPRPTPVLALLTVLALSACEAAYAQQQPPIRPLGLITAESKEPIASAYITLPIPDGRIFINDYRAHRVLLFDSTLATYKVVLDSVAGRADSYGRLNGGLVPYLGDSALFVNFAGPWMLVLDAKGTIVRTMAMPVNGAVSIGLFGGPYGNPIVDRSGRLLYQGNAVLPVRPKTDVPGSIIMTRPDSSPVVRFDFVTHRLDTLGMYRVANPRYMVHRFETGATALAMVYEPIAIIDDWAALPDGSIAFVRGRDFRVEWVNADGSHVVGPKLPYDWERIEEESKPALVDATRAIFERQRASSIERGVVRNPPPIYVVSPNEVPDYRPAFDQAAVRADADGNVWIRTTKQHDKKWVYYVVDRRGELVDRVAAPVNRFIIGFGGPNVAYLAVVDSGGIRIDRARIH